MNNFSSTSLARKHGGVIIPASIRDVLNIKKNDLVGIAWSPRKILIEVGYISNSMVSPPALYENILPISPDILRLAEINPGDILKFTNLSNARWMLTSLDQSENLLNQSNKFCPKGNPVPPEWLIQCFSSVPDQVQYLNSGFDTYKWMESSVKNEINHNLNSFENILDFGCGAARVLRNFDFNKHNLHGCDLHIHAINWCKEALPIGNFQHGFTKPKTTYKDDSFEYIYAISVLTHLDYDMQILWLLEWSRILKKGGLVFATFNGDDFVNKYLYNSGEYFENIKLKLTKNNGFAFISDDGWKGVFPDFYQTSYQNIENVKNNFSLFFEIVKIYPAGDFVNRQNVVLMRKR